MYPHGASTIRSRMSGRKKQMANCNKIGSRHLKSHTLYAVD